MTKSIDGELILASAKARMIEHFSFISFGGNL